MSGFRPFSTYWTSSGGICGRERSGSGYEAVWWMAWKDWERVRSSWARTSALGLDVDVDVDEAEVPEVEEPRLDSGGVLTVVLPTPPPPGVDVPPEETEVCWSYALT